MPTPSDVSTVVADRVIRPDELRDANEIAVLRRLIAHGPASRTAIGAALGLTPAPVTRIVARLAQRGLVRDGESPSPPSRGRPAVPVELVPGAVCVVGAHVGLDLLTVGRTGLDGAVRHQQRVLHHGSWTVVRDHLAAYVATHGSEDDTPPAAVGLVVGGHVDPGTGTIVSHPVLAWRDVDARDELAAVVGVPVVVDASVRAHAHADLLFGAAAPFRDFVHVFVGNLVEVAVVVDRRVRSGRGGLAGDLSSWPAAAPGGGTSDLTEVVGAQALLRRARELGLVGAQADVDALVAVAAEPGGHLARELLLQRASDVGVLLARLDALLAPEAIVVSSAVLAADGALEAAKATMSRLRRGAGPLPAVLPTRYGSNPVVAAAAAVALERSVLAAARRPGRPRTSSTEALR